MRNSVNRLDNSHLKLENQFMYSMSQIHKIEHCNITIGYDKLTKIRFFNPDYKGE